MPKSNSVTRDQSWPESTNWFWIIIRIVFDITEVDTERYIGLHIEWPILAIILYVWMVFSFYPASKKEDQRSSTKLSIAGKRLLCAYNLSLAVFSMWSAYGMFNYRHLFVWDQQSSLCGGIFRKAVFEDSHLSLLLYLFYLSKYVEFADTAILLFQNKKPSFLQIFHHIGALINMYLTLITRLPSAAWYCLVNATVHSVMYSYYALSALGYRFSMKWLITSLQIGQLISAVSVTAHGLLFNYLIIDHPLNNAYSVETCRSNYPTFHALIDFYTLVYIAVLVVLFVRFFRQSYSTKSQKRKSSVKRD